MKATGVAVGMGELVAVKFAGSPQGQDMPVSYRDASGFTMSSLTLEDEASRSALKRSLSGLGIVGGDVSLTLPDTLAKTSLLEFEELPADAAEACELIKWKAAKSAFMKPDECSIDFSILADKTVDGVPKKIALSVVIKNEIISAYEEVFSELGTEVSVPWIGINSISLFNAFSNHLQGTPSFVMLIAAEDFFTFLVFNRGELDFYRMKQGEPGDLREVAKSFAFYAGKNPDVALDKVYLFNDYSGLVAGAGAGVSDSTSQAQAIIDALSDVTDVKVEHVRAGDVLTIITGEQDKDSSQASGVLLLAAAGALLHI